MKLIFVTLVCFNVAICLAKSPKSKYSRVHRKPQEFEYVDYGEYNSPQAAATINHYDTYALANADVLPKNGFSVGSGLRSIAQGSADQANMAVANQHAAAKQAAYVAKNTLAQAAAQASATAQAALAGKQVILSGLEQQVRDAKVGLDGENMQLMQAQRAAQASQQAAQQAAHQVNVIQAALNAAQSTQENSQQAASEAAGELAAQQAMVGAAKQRLASLSDQLTGARIDFAATQSAAQNAQFSAQQAQSNAAEAAAKAAVAAAEVDAAQAAKSAAAAAAAGAAGAGKGGGHVSTASDEPTRGSPQYDDFTTIAGDEGILQYGYKLQGSINQY